MAQAQLAKKLGVTRQAVSKALLRGKTPGQILYAKRGLAHGGARKGAGRPQGGPIKGKDSKGKLHTITEADIRNKLAVAEKNEVELAKMRGELVQAGPLKAWYGGIAIRSRDIIMSIEELADRIRQAPDEIEARLLIRTECTRAMQEISRYAKFTAGGLANGNMKSESESEETPSSTPSSMLAPVAPLAKKKPGPKPGSRPGRKKGKK